jgi:copper resistance protein D
MTDQLNIGIRFALYANLMLLFGLPLFERYALKGPERLQNAVAA